MKRQLDSGYLEREVDPWPVRAMRFVLRNEQSISLILWGTGMAVLILMALGLVQAWSQ